VLDGNQHSQLLPFYFQLRQILVDLKIVLPWFSCVVKLGTVGCHLQLVLGQHHI
jgi:hypothetical protein